MSSLSLSDKLLINGHCFPPLIPKTLKINYLKTDMILPNYEGIKFNQKKISKRNKK